MFLLLLLVFVNINIIIIMVYYVYTYLLQLDTHHKNFPNLNTVEWGVPKQGTELRKPCKIGWWNPQRRLRYRKEKKMNSFWTD